MPHSLKKIEASSALQKQHPKVSNNYVIKSFGLGHLGLRMWSRNAGSSNDQPVDSVQERCWLTPCQAPPTMADLWDLRTPKPQSTGRNITVSNPHHLSRKRKLNFFSFLDPKGVIEDIEVDPLPVPNERSIGSVRVLETPVFPEPTTPIATRLGSSSYSPARHKIVGYRGFFFFLIF
jgi:hypothetical protein